MSQVILGELDRCLGKRPPAPLQPHLGPPSPPPSKRACIMAARAETASLPATTITGTTTTVNTAPAESSTTPCRRINQQNSDWDTSPVRALAPPPPKSPENRQDDGCVAKSVDEYCKRELDHFPRPAIAFPTPTLEFDFRVAVTLKSEPSQVQGRSHKEVMAVSSGTWSGSFGHGKVMTGGYDLGQARGFRPIRIVEGAFIMQTTDESPATLEMRTRGSLSGPCDILDALLSPRNPKDVDPRKYGFRMFLTIKTADKRYAEIVNCGLWVTSGAWQGDELIIDAYRVS